MIFFVVFHAQQTIVVKVIYTSLFCSFHFLLATPCIAYFTVLFPALGSNQMHFVKIAELCNVSMQLLISQYVLDCDCDNDCYYNNIFVIIIIYALQSDDVAEVL